MEGDAAYFSRRAREEIRAAQNATHETARQLHLEMADRYDALAAALEARQGEPARLAGAG